MAILHSTTHNRKQECIPVGCVQPTRCRPYRRGGYCCGRCALYWNAILFCRNIIWYPDHSLHSGEITITQVSDTYENNPEYPNEGVNMVLVLQLEAAQEVWLEPIPVTALWGADTTMGMWSWFSGHLVYAL